MATLEEVKMLFAEFDREAISWRAQSVTKDGSKAMALAYIDARDVMERLDQAVGATDWQDRYEFHGSRTICYLSIRVEGEWITKADGAGDSDVEAEKGAISDALKRAAVKWGIGRYLYALDAPWVPCETTEWNGKKQWKRWTDDPWKFVKGAAPPARSAAALKKSDANGEDAWDRLLKELRKDLEDCHSLVALDRLRTIYRDRARKDRWPTDWLASLKNEFDKLQASFPPADDDTFPGDLPNGTGRNAYVDNYSAG